MKQHRQLHEDFQETTLVPSPAALAFATRITSEQFQDVYVFAVEIDRAFSAALERTRMEERRRIFNMGAWELIQEFWRSKKLYRPDVIETRANRPNPL